MIIPMLTCQDALAEIDFCKKVFGAVELSRREGEGGNIIHATLKIEEELLMIHGEVAHLASRQPEQDGSSPVVIYLYGLVVDTVIERAVSEKAKVLLPAEDQFWGDRVGRIMDPAGHVWNIAARINNEN